MTPAQNWFDAIWTFLPSWAVRHRRDRRFGGWATVTVGIVLCLVGLVVFRLPAQATEIQLSTRSPQLGETIALTLPADAPPTIALDDATYPAFAVAPNRYRALLPTTPLDTPGRKTIRVSVAGQGREVPIVLRDRPFPTQRLRLRSGTPTRSSEIERQRMREFRELVTPEQLWRGRFVRPAQGRVSSVYGVRRYYNGVFARDYYHRGVDYAGGTGTPVFAPAAGRVVLVGRESQGFIVNGNAIGIDHGQGVTSIFIHLSRIDVREGDLVRPGQTIGGIGATGLATGPNLHWGLHVNGKAVDPADWFNGRFP